MNNYKKSDEYSESKDPAFTKAMAEAVKATIIHKKPTSTVQAASTQKVLDMTNEELFQYRMRTIDSSKAQVRDEHGEVYVAERPVTVDLITREESRRRGVKNTIGKEVATQEKGFSPEKREKAVDAFRFTMPTELTKEQLESLVSLESIEELKQIPEYEWKKMSFLEALWHRIKGNPIRRTEK